MQFTPFKRCPNLVSIKNKSTILKKSTMRIRSSITSIALLLFFFLLGGLTFTCSAQIFKIEKNEKSPWKSPSTASLQSLVLPGAGYLYQDKLFLGYTTLGIELALGGIGTYYYSKTVSTKGRLPESIKAEIEQNKNIGGTFMAIAGAIHLFQFIHSGILAHKSNKVNGYAKSNSELKFYCKGLGVAAAYRF